MTSSSNKELVYFKKWVSPVGDEVIATRPDIKTVKLEYSDPDEKIWAAFQTATGYHCLPRTESEPRWFPSAALLARAPRLLACSSAGAGYDVIDVAACTAAGVLVVNQSGTNKEAVAEHVLGFMLTMSKKISYWDREMRRRPNVDRFNPQGHDIGGKTVGIIGIGHIGGRVAQLCGGILGMPILAYDPYLSADQIRAKGATKVELDELLSRADFVSINCPHSKETEGMFGAAQFARMRPEAYFITTARGPVHDEKALVEALKSNRIAGAGIDVWHTEPPPIDHPLMACENAVLTPHMAGITFEATDNAAGAGARQWMTIFDGQVPPRLVNPEVWPLYSKRFEAIMGFKPAPLASGSA